MDLSREAFAALRDGLLDRLRSVLSRHGKKLWWLHSFYALALGASVVLFAQKGISQARFLAISIVAAWLLVIALFRIFGSGVTQESFEAPASRLAAPTSASPGARLRFFVMTYVLKNLYQGMLFFLLPFYWKSSTFGTPNMAFVVLLGGCALVATLDVVFDEVIIRRRLLASIFHGFTLFATMTLLVPALFTDTRSMYALVAAAAITVLAFWTLHVPARAFLRNRNIALLLATVLGGMGVAWAARSLVPPVPMYVGHAAVGPVLMKDGRLEMEVQTLHTSAVHQLVAVTDVVIPAGKGDELVHVWRRAGEPLVTLRPRRTKGPSGTLRLQSMLGAEKLPKELAGAWTIDVMTVDDQLVGRLSFQVIE